MIISIDTETQGLNTQNWIMGCITKESGKTIAFRNRHEMFLKIQEIADFCKTRGKTLLIYAHNMLYDYNVVTKGENTKHHYIYSHYPFIVDQKDDNGRIYCKWSSTTSLWRGALSEIGEALGYEKTPTPEWLKQDEYEPNFIELNEAEAYMKRDSEIVMKYLIELRKRLTKQGMKPRWLITASQVGISNLVKEIKKLSNAKDYFYDVFKRQFYYTKAPEDIHEAVRGGRVQTIQTGEFYDVDMIDINSHYPECLATMQMPDLSTQIFHKKPIQRGWDMYDLLNKIGITNCEVVIPKNRYGMLPVRISETDTEYPNNAGDKLMRDGHLDDAEVLTKMLKDMESIQDKSLTRLHVLIDLWHQYQLIDEVDKNV